MLSIFCSRSTGPVSVAADAGISAAGGSAGGGVTGASTTGLFSGFAVGVGGACFSGVLGGSTFAGVATADVGLVFAVSFFGFALAATSLFGVPPPLLPDSE